MLADTSNARAFVSTVGDIPAGMHKPAPKPLPLGWRCLDHDTKQSIVIAKIAIVLIRRGKNNTEQVVGR
jgi:hypothetical protein